MNNLIIVSGHYGAGKTSFALSLARALRACNDKSVSLIDLDIINPYFRSSDYTKTLDEEGVPIISPRFAGTTLENPSISPEVLSTIKSAGEGGITPWASKERVTQSAQPAPCENPIVIIDTGGDAEGVRALARYSDAIKAKDYQMLYVFNQKRLMTSTANDALALMQEIENASCLRISGIVNNTHLKSETTIETVRQSMPYAIELCELSGVPLSIVCVPPNSNPKKIKSLQDDFAGVAFKVLPISDYTKTPWEHPPHHL